MTTDLYQIIQEEAEALNYDAYVVGGAVRDLLLALPGEKDVDLVIVGEGSTLAKKLSERLDAQVQVFDRFLTAKVSELKDYGEISEVDFVTARKESYAKPGALPDASPGTLEEDLGRRDFSLNALALPLGDFLAFRATTISTDELVGKVIDHHQGIDDLSNRRFRILHEQSFLDDPTRIIRLARYVVRIDGVLEEKTSSLLGDALEAEVFKTVSLQRLWGEFLKALSENSLAAVFQRLSDYAFFHQHSELSTLFQGLSKEQLKLYATHVEGFSFEERYNLLIGLFLRLHEMHGVPTLEVMSQIGVGKKGRKSVQGSLSEKEQSLIDSILES